MDNETINIKNILLVEDDPRDVELTLGSAGGVPSGQQGRDCRATARRRWIIFIAGGNSKRARAAIPLSCCSTTRCRRSAGWKC